LRGVIGINWFRIKVFTSKFEKKGAVLLPVMGMLILTILLTLILGAVILRLWHNFGHTDFGDIITTNHTVIDFNNSRPLDHAQ
jgi:hypothetical protein